MLWLALAPLALAQKVDVDPLLAEAVEHWNAQRLPEARAKLDQAVQAAPDRTEPHLLRGQVRYEQGDISGARSELTDVFQGSGWKDLVDQGRAGGEMAGLEEIVFDGAAVLVLAHIHEDALTDAASVLQQVNKTRPSSALLSFAGVQLLVAKKDYTGARAALEVARKQFPGDPNLGAADASIDAAASDWREGYNAAVDHQAAGRFTDCLGLLPATSKEPKVLQLGYTCAVQAKDLAAAEARWKAVGVGGLPFEGVAGHAMLRSEKGNPQGALDLLDQVKAGDPKVVKTLRVRFLGELGRGAEAIPLLADPDVAVAEARNLAARLVNAEDYANAGLALTSVCPREEASKKKACEDLQKEVRERAP